ncbi:hypothetical protein IJI89_00760 [Candidatus Saccharibacteria bacterium]|nr:hypothetical protein [Candidatus Saccharibacteria bacterium]
MSILIESLIEEKDEDNFLLDIIDTTIKNGFPAYVSKDEKILSIALPLENKKEIVGEAFIVTEVNMEEPRLFDCDIAINSELREIHLLRFHSSLSEVNECYMAELTSDPGTPFFIETINRIAVWDKKLEGKELKASLSAFATKISIYNNIKEFNKKTGFEPVDTEAGKIIGFSETFCAPMSENGIPYTYFLGTIKHYEDVEIKLKKGTILFTIIYVNSHFGILPVVACKNRFDLSRLEAGKAIEVSAVIKANLATDATPKAIVNI